MTISSAHIWWNQVSGPSSFMKKVTDNLIQEKSCALFLSGDIPWYSVFSDMIKRSLRMANSDNSIEEKDISETGCTTSEMAGRYIAGIYCTPDKLTDYWPGESYAEFLAESDDIILNSKYIILKGINKDNFNAWYDFVKEYASNIPKGKKRATFILECSSECYAEKNKNVKVINWNELVHNYDYYMFCSILVSEFSCSDGMKRYIADLAYSLCEFRAEAAAGLLEYKASLAEDPHTVYEKWSKNFMFSDGEKFVPLIVNINSVLTEVQVKNLFPAIERYRRRFITNHYSEIERNLPVKNLLVNEKITEPYECELNLLRMMADKNQIQTSSEEKNTVRFMHEARNRVVHNKNISFEKVLRVLEYTGDF